MSEYVDFHYMPLEGKITGEQVLKQTEDAINDLGNKVYNLDIDQSEIDEAVEKSNEAINTANSALSAVTTGRSVWFNNVAEMIATDIKAGVTAETKGYYVANDGGNALYLIRQEKSGDVVDGGSLVALNNGNMAELVADGTVNVKQFGAIGNGTDDDTIVFQNTSSYAQANGFVPFVGVATYKITGNVTGTFNSFGEVTITGGGTVDIINLHEVVSDVSDIRDEVVDETASAKAYSESAATSATNASNSASSAQATATALTDIYNEAISSGQIVAPAVDPTLTISGAAADAKVVGDNFATVLRLLSNDATSIPSSSDLDDYTTAGNYKVANSTTAATITHAPLTTHAYRLIVLQISETAKIMQIALINKFNGLIYTRRKDGTWTAWERVATGSEVDEITAALQKSFSFDANAATIIPNGTNLNTLTTVGNYKATSNASAATMTNCPVSSAFMLKVLNTSTTSTNAQILIPNAPSTGSMYYRLSATATWHKITDERDTIIHKNVILTSSNYLIYWPNGSFNDAEPNTIYGINEDTYPLLTDGPSGNGVTGQPSNQSVPDSPPAVEGRIRGTLITYSQVAGQGKQSGLVQLYVGYRETEYSPILAYRIAVYTGTYQWSNWAKFEQNGYLHAGNQIVYGGQPYISNAPFTDLNDAPGNSIYHVDLNMDGRDADHTLGHHPTPGYSSIVITYSFSYTTPHARMQMVCSIDGRMYWRYGYLQATDDYRWTGWNQCVSDNGDYLRNKGRLTNGADLNSVTDNSIYLLGANGGAGYVNDPITGAGFLTTKSTNAIILQTVEALTGTRYSRYSDDSGSTWSAWV